MMASPAVRAARKKAHLARLKAKRENPEDYPAYFANQPQQIMRAQAEAEIRVARQEVVNTAEAVQIAEITGEGLVEAQEKATIARLVLQKRIEAMRPKPQLTLTAVGGL